MFDAATLKLVAAIVIFSIPVWLCGARLPGRSLGDLRFDRARAQGFGAVIGLAVGVGFLLLIG